MNISVFYRLLDFYFYLEVVVRKLNGNGQLFFILKFPLVLVAAASRHLKFCLCLVPPSFFLEQARWVQSIDEPLQLSMCAYLRKELSWVCVFPCTFVFAYAFAFAFYVMSIFGCTQAVTLHVRRHSVPAVSLTAQHSVLFGAFSNPLWLSNFVMFYAFSSFTRFFFFLMFFSLWHTRLFALSRHLA